MLARFGPIMKMLFFSSLNISTASVPIILDMSLRENDRGIFLRGFLS